MDPCIKDKVVQVCLVVIAAIMITFSLYHMKPVLVPFVFSIFLFMLISPLVDWLQKKIHLPKSLGMGLTFVVLILIFALTILMLGVSVKGFVKSSGEYQLKLMNLVDEMSFYLGEHGYPSDLSVIKRSLLELPILPWITRFSGGLVGVIGNMLLIFIFTLFLLIGKKEEGEGSILDKEVQIKIRRYLTTKFLTSTVTGILVGTVLAILQVQLALMFGFLAFFLNFIPNVGSMIATLLPLPVVFLQYGPSITLLLAAVIPSVIQFTIGNIIDPKLMGENLGLHPAVILLSLLFWGFIWGVPGMFLSVPITAIIKLILSRSTQTKPLSDILEGKFR